MLHIDNFFNVLYSEVGKVLCGALRYSALWWSSSDGFIYSCKDSSELL